MDYQVSSQNTTYLRHFVLVVVAVLAVSVSSILIKVSTAPAGVIGMYRLLFASLLLLPVFIRNRQQLPGLSRRDWLLIVVSGTFLGLHFLFWMESLKLTSVASSMIVLSLQPVFVMIGAFFLFSERTHAQGVIAMGIAICGSVIVALGDTGMAQTSLLGDGLSLLGTVAVSGYMLTGQRVRSAVPSALYNFLVFSVAAGLLLGFNLTVRVPLLAYSPREWAIFVLLAIIPTLFGHALFNWLLRYFSATLLSMSILAEPVGAIILAVALLREPLHLFQVIGGCCTLYGVGMFLWTRRGRHPDGALAPVSEDDTQCS